MTLITPIIIITLITIIIIKTLIMLGKSAVVKSLIKYLEVLRLRHKLRVCAPTGCAADNIGGSTLHSILKMCWGDNAKKNKKHPVKKDNSKVKDVDILLIDEVSMVGCEMLNNISTTLCEMKGVTGTDMSFGGLTMIFAGDFYQLPPVSG